MVSPSVKALNAHTHIGTHRHTCIRSRSRSPVRSPWKLRTPPPLSLPRISSSILHDSLQSVNLEPSLRDAISGMLAGGRRKQQEEEDGWGKGREQTGWRRSWEGWSWIGRKLVYGLLLSPSVSFYVPLSVIGWWVATMFPHHRLWSASSLSGGVASIMHFFPHRHTHLETYREHWVQPTGSEVKSIVYVCVRIHVACLVNLLPYYASCYFRSVLECSLCMPTCANEALSTCALSKERWNFSSQKYGLEDSGMNILNFSHSAALERKEKTTKTLWGQGSK